MGIEFNPELILQNLTGSEQKTGGKKLSKTSDIDVAGALKELGKTNKTDSEKAQEKLDNIKASNGMTYKEAKAKMKEIEHKYIHNNNSDKMRYLREVVDPEPEVPGRPGMTYSVRIVHLEVNARALPEPDRTEYRRAKAAVEEIEHNNSALVSDARSVLGFDLKV